MTDEPAVAPWTDEEVRNLERWQTCAWVHPYTCGHCRDAHLHGSDEHRLVPTKDGWWCPTCDYRQDWCWGPMLDGPWPDPFRRP